MQIDWPRYVRTAKEQGLTGIEVVRLIQKETNRKVNVSEVKRRLAGTESSMLSIKADTWIFLTISAGFSQISVNVS
ncbi:hypothetical protein [Parasutterella excrementihominis]|uniref:hypothetical protein n=1 Tax=Parasutterella excrementihominis TaxID=487175 RepID=UPI0024330681|nr:hypothetical protein [Parasutterella excrementihominis]